MHDSTCQGPRCNQPVTDAYLCDSCTGRARDHLRDLTGDPAPPADRPTDPGLLADLEVLMARQDVADPDTARPAEQVDDDAPAATDEPIAAHAMPVHLGAGKILGAAHGDLRRWVRAVVEQRHGAALRRDFATIALERLRRTEALQLPSRIPGVHLNGYLAHEPRRARYVQLPDPRQPRELALWLGRHLNDVRQHPTAGNIAAGLEHHRRRAEQAVTGRAVEYLGPCSECWHKGRESLLYAERGDDLVTCRGCGCSYDVGELREWLLDKVADERLRAADLSRALVDHVRQVRDDLGVLDYPTATGRPLTAASIRSMADRGRIVRYERTRAELDAGVDPEPRYRVGEVMELVETLARDDREKMLKRTKQTQTR